MVSGVRLRLVNRQNGSDFFYVFVFDSVENVTNCGKRFGFRLRRQQYRIFQPTLEEPARTPLCLESSSKDDPILGRIVGAAHRLPSLEIAFNSICAAAIRRSRLLAISASKSRPAASASSTLIFN